MPQPNRLDRLPPHSIEAEQGVLGCCLLAPNENIERTAARLKNGSDAFYDLRHRTIYEFMAAMAEKREAIDLVTLGQRLKDTNQLEGLGGLAYLSGLLDAVPNASNIGYYLEIVAEKHMLRRALSTCTAVITRVHEDEGDVDKLLEEVESDILKIRADNFMHDDDPTMRDMVKDAVDRVQARCQSPESDVLPTGLRDFDFLLDGGFRSGEVIIVAARPSMGKTALAQAIAMHFASQNKSVGFISIEMTRKQLTDRMLACRSRVNLRKICYDHPMTEGQIRALAVAAGTLAKYPIRIDDSSDQTMPRIRSRLRQWRKELKIELAIIDYLQLINDHRKGQRRREEEVAYVSKQIKAAAKELGIPILVLCQLNRKIEEEKARKPRMSDLRESGAIEQDADIILALYKAQGAEDDEDENKTAPREVGASILKQRNGAQANLRFVFLPEFTQFEDAARQRPT